MEAKLAEVHGRSARLAWLIEKLEEYVGRVLGFARTAGVPVESVVRSDFFRLVQAAASLLMREAFAQANGTLSRVAEAYTTSLDAIESSPTLDALARLDDHTKKLRLMFDASRGSSSKE